MDEGSVKHQDHGSLDRPVLPLVAAWGVPSASAYNDCTRGIFCLLSEFSDVGFSCFGLFVALIRRIIR